MSSQKSLALVMLMGVRLAGPMTYYPAVARQDGSKVNARCEGSFYVNDFYIDKQGNKVDSSHVVKLVFWNSNSAPAGKGLADTAAKFIGVGKEISCQAQINTYQGRVYDASDNVIAYPDGTPVLTKRTSFVVEPRTLRLGDDSDKLLQAEYAQFAANGGVITFDSRPADWRTPNTDGSKQWTGISSWRSSVIFDGALASYGYAKIGAVQGTIVASHAAAEIAQVAGAQASGGAAVVVGAEATPAPTPELAVGAQASGGPASY